VQVGTQSAPVDNGAGPSASSVIYIDHGGTGASGIVNTVTNNGWVYGYTGPANATAVLRPGSPRNLTIRH
jgi:N-acetylglucosamine kinase-like BadF-type ATPase